MTQIEKFLNEANINGFEHRGGTDKASEHSYCEIYQNLFNQLNTKDKKHILEIGVFQGGWTFAMLNLIPNCKIDAVDIEDQFCPTLKENLIVTDFLKNLNYQIRDAYVQETVDFLPKNYYNLIIDDGPHTFESQMYVVKNYLDKLYFGGSLVIEDIKTLEHAEILVAAVPLGYTTSIYDLRNKIGRFDDIMIVVSKN